MDPVKTPLPRGVLFYVGATGLLAVMFIEVVAVIGRHARLPLLGALEMAQASIVPAACAAMIIAALAGAHAAVHLVTERLPDHLRDWTTRASSLLAALFFGALCAGTCWLAVEFWDSYEETDVLHIPFRPLRVLVAVSAGALAAIFLRRAFGPRSPR
jgi:TRAP-type C4-dicarboxylate transport system permease small subunit